MANKSEQDLVLVHKDVVPNLCTCLKILHDLAMKPEWVREDITRVKYVNKLIIDTYKQMTEL